MNRPFVLLILLLIPATAHAMAEVVQAVGMGLVIFTTGGWAIVGYALLIASGVYGAEQARKKAAEAREQARQAHNAGLQDRTITRVATDAPHRTVYGRARVGSDIVAIFASGARDEYKHLVCVHAAHECDAIEEIYVAGKALGTLDGNGDVTTGDYVTLRTSSIDSEAHTGTSFDLAHTPIAGSTRITYDTGDGWAAEPHTVSGATITITSGISRTYYCHYEYQDNIPRVRVTKHLGTPTDPADAGLMAAVPSKWFTTSVLRGFCYTVVRLDLNQAEFQGGLPPIEVLLRGKKLYDPRDASTIWNQNVALATYDYLTSEMCGVDAADLPTAEYITAANVCDEDIGTGVKRYTINGDVRADQDPRKVLETLAQSMAGAVVATSWSISAGKYVAPVMALEQSDIVGALSIIGGTPDADLYNGVKGQYIGAENLYVATDVKPYQNAAYVAADGRELWTDIEFPFSDTAQRVHNLARIFCEDQRNGFTVKAAFSLKTWKLKPFNRVTLTSAVFGWDAKVFRVTDKRYGPQQAVELTLKEDTASIWDLADAVTVDSTPNTNLQNPFLVGQCGNVQMTEQIYQTSGSAGVRSKAIVTWDAPAVGIDLSYELEYKLYTSGVWIELFNGRDTVAELTDLAPGRYDFRVKGINILGAQGQCTDIKTFEVYGLQAAPANVAGFSVACMGGLAIAQWTLSTDLDVRIGGRVEIRFSPLVSGATFSNGVRIPPDQDIAGDATTAFLPLATGTYMAKFVDSTGNYSVTEASFVATESLVTGWTTVLTSTQHAAFTGTKTDCVVSGSNLIFTGTALAASYAYAATLDSGSVLTRRYHGHIKARAYNADDLFDSDEMFDSAEMFDESSVINDCNAWHEIRVSDDNATWTAWQPFAVADFSGRYAQVRLQMTRLSNMNNIEIQELSTKVKVTP
jgi:hypothetical protein